VYIFIYVYDTPKTVTEASYEHDGIWGSCHDTRFWETYRRLRWYLFVSICIYLRLSLSPPPLPLTPTTSVTIFLSLHPPIPFSTLYPSPTFLSLHLSLLLPLPYPSLSFSVLPPPSFPTVSLPHHFPSPPLFLSIRSSLLAIFLVWAVWRRSNPWRSYRYCQQIDIRLKCCVDWRVDLSGPRTNAFLFQKNDIQPYWEG